MLWCAVGERRPVLTFRRETSWVEAWKREPMVLGWSGDQTRCGDAAMTTRARSAADEMDER